MSAVLQVIAFGIGGWCVGTFATNWFMQIRKGAKFNWRAIACGPAYITWLQRHGWSIIRHAYVYPADGLTYRQRDDKERDELRGRLSQS